MSDVSTFLLFLRVGFSLAVVLALIWAAARFAKRRGKIVARQSETNLEIVARRQLGRRGSLVVVESGDRTLLVGVTETHIGLVADLSPDRPALGTTAATTDAASDAARRRPVEVAEVPSPSLPADVVALPLRGAGASSADGPKRESLVDALRDLTVRR